MDDTPRLSHYTRKSEPWTDNEVNDIRREYDEEEMDISTIGRIHRRTPGSISYKLKSLGLLSHNTLARGYQEYKSSDLYREIVNSSPNKVKAPKNNLLHNDETLLEVCKEIRDLLKLLLLNK